MFSPQELKERNVLLLIYFLHKGATTMKQQQKKKHIHPSTQQVITSQVCNVDNPKDVCAAVLNILMNTNDAEKIASIIILAALEASDLSRIDALRLVNAHFDDLADMDDDDDDWDYDWEGEDEE